MFGWKELLSEGKHCFLPRTLAPDFSRFHSCVHSIRAFIRFRFNTSCYWIAAIADGAEAPRIQAHIIGICREVVCARGLKSFHWKIITEKVCAAAAHFDSLAEIPDCSHLCKKQSPYPSLVCDKSQLPPMLRLPVPSARGYKITRFRRTPLSRAKMP